MKTIKALAKELAKREGKRKQVDIAQISEILGHLSDILTENPSVWTLIVANGIKRAKKKAKMKRTKK